MSRRKLERGPEDTLVKVVGGLRDQAYKLADVNKQPSQYKEPRATKKLPLTETSRQNLWA